MAGAVDNMLLLEWACGVYWHAAALGKPRVMEREQLDAVVQQFVDKNYGTTQERDG
jgi:L-fuculose-phosphate aldolase